ncbi:MAG: glycosyltransferase family 2 protein [Promethearchaeota archaeon]
MTNVLLSFCIPTYNRPERIYSLLKQALSFQNQEIEIVIGDDNPSSDKTQEVVKKFKDPRIVYFRNKKNLGMDGNMLRTIHKASGEFVFIMMDDDDIEMESIPWILRKIKENKNLTQLCGSIGNKNPTYKTRYHPLYFKYNFGEKLLKCGVDSLLKLLFYYPHGSGIIIKKKSLNLNKALKYNGFLWMQQALIAQALLLGDTLCTSRIFAHIGEINYGSDLLLINGKNWWHPLSFISQTKVRIQIIYDITKGKKIRKILINRQIGYLSNHFFHIIYLSRKSFSFSKSLKYTIEGLGIVLTMKFSKYPIFWINLIIGVIIIYTKNIKFKKLYRFFSKK